jgi:hypothetical protein
MINTENGEMSVGVGGSPFRIVAVDGTDLNEPGLVRDSGVLVTAGGRADLEIVMPADGTPMRVDLGGSVGIVLGSRRYDAPAVARSPSTVDLLG